MIKIKVTLRFYHEIQGIKQSKILVVWLRLGTCNYEKYHNFTWFPGVRICGKAQFPHSFGCFSRNYAETVPFCKISTPGNQVKLRYFLQCVVCCTIWYHMSSFKNIKDTHGWVLLLVKLQALVCNFTKNNTPPWVFFTFLKIVQMVRNRPMHLKLCSTWWAAIPKTSVSFQILTHLTL